MNRFRHLLTALDRRQRNTPVLSPAFAVQKKFNDDQLGQYVVALGWYGFVSIYPLLLVLTTILGFIGAASLGSRIVSTLHEFPVVGSNFNPAHPSEQLHGSTLGLIVGLAFLVYGAQGVMQSAQHAMAQAWNVRRADRPAWLARLGRSLLGLLIIGGSFVVNAALATVATGHGRPWLLRIAILIAMLAVNTLLFWIAFIALTPPVTGPRSMLPGAVLGSVGYTLLITVGSGLIQHQLRHSSDTYGQFGVVIGLVGFLFLLAKISLYAAELNCVLERHLWPRSLVSDDPTEADTRVLQYIADEVLREAEEVKAGGATGGVVSAAQGSGTAGQPAQ